MWNTRLSWRVKIISVLVSIIFFFAALSFRSYRDTKTLTFDHTTQSPNHPETAAPHNGLETTHDAPLSHALPGNEPSSSAITEARNTTFDIVISYYNEDLDQVKTQLDAIKSLSQLSQYDEIRTYFYTKNPDVDLDTLQHLFGGHASLLPNRGRESGTYLSHIIQNWHDLGSHTMFVQAVMHQPEDGIRRVNESLVPPLSDGSPSTGVLTMGVLAECQCTSCHDSWNSARIYSRIPEIYALLNGELCPQNVLLTFSGQMVVSRKRIHQRKRKAYQYLKDVLESDASHFVHLDESGLEDTPDNPSLGHSYERFYMVLWDCAGTKPLEVCGPDNFRKLDDPISSCQCMDE